MSDSTKFRKTIKGIALMTTISSYLVGSILAGVFLGRWIDEKYDGNGIFLALGAVLGISSAIVGIYFAVRKFLGDEST
ncbi:AtpZ/AtpI family protein [Evansella sp. AB-P1]|uniref:AtpZ/AtpI family protein n=1 Tax=Evansella sp. AB-P1 TaxID=3037653 RepID=UPI00241D6798|nr:AtpZ/AtpI family protein [Evansella sp. AB-P1]MDG5787315.1 AtpZ/AtpI family protein [Evansella sp. AB-P1]